MRSARGLRRPGGAALPGTPGGLGRGDSQLVRLMFAQLCPRWLSISRNCISRLHTKCSLNSWSVTRFQRWKESSFLQGGGGLKDWVCRSQVPAKSQPTKATPHKCLTAASEGSRGISPILALPRSCSLALLHCPSKGRNGWTACEKAFGNVWCLQHLDGGAVPCSERPLSPGQPLSLSSRSSLTSGRALLEARARVCLSTGTGSSSGSSAGHRARHPRPTALAASLLARPSRSLG
ncbi:uncharacterized protein LOC117200980 isoform X1 [Orcinus orca]|uniref:uncharacterized protein LOC117200980 isoform X1 n=1 Tax=Orcinus orca TaxID=9733 RepID=UPI0021129682|nr:uncharacterized protein LOC117200980 isoform X1 [Orcinus orca]